MSKQMPNTLCSEPGCRERAVEGNRCPVHVKAAWKRPVGSKVAAELPSDWSARKKIVLARDGSKCVQCGKTYGLEVDHIIPRSEGGGHEIDNLQTLCSSCHKSKTNYQTREFVSRKQKSAIDLMRSIQDGSFNDVKPF